MATIAGTLSTLTKNPSTVEEVWLQSTDVDARGNTVILPEVTKLLIEDGQVSFEAYPNTKGTLVVVYGDTTPSNPIPIFIGENDTQALGDVIAAGRLEIDSNPDEIQALLSEALAAVGAARNQAEASAASAQESATSAQESEASATASAESAANSDSSAQEAASSAKSAQGSAQEAATSAQASSDSAAASAQSAQSAAGSSTTAQDAAEAASTSAQNASLSESSALNAAEAAATSANAASESEGNALTYRDEARGYAEAANVGLIDGTVSEEKLDESLTAKVNGEHVHDIPDVTGLQGALDGKADSAHSHTLSDITTPSTSTVNSSAAGAIVTTDSAGKLNANTPTDSLNVANKAYVDGVFPRNVAIFRGFVSAGQTSSNAYYPAESIFRHDGDSATFASVLNGYEISIDEPGAYQINVFASSRTKFSDGSRPKFVPMLVGKYNWANTDFEFAIKEQPPYSSVEYHNARMHGACQMTQFMTSAKIKPAVESKISNASADIFVVIIKLASGTRDVKA